MELPTEAQREAYALEKRDAMRGMMSDVKMYHPVFCLVEVTDAYWTKIASHSIPRSFGGDSFLEISSANDTSFEAIQESDKEAITTRFDNPSDNDFVGQTVDQVYDFYKRHLRLADDNTDFQHFSAFTFAVVDEMCLQSNPQQLLLCSDAPDYGEDDEAMVLKQVRIDATLAWHMSSRIEDLSWTPKEVELWARDQNHEEFTVLRLDPISPKLLGPSPWKIATMGQARATKRAAIKSAESAGWVVGKGRSDGNTESGEYKLEVD